MVLAAVLGLSGGTVAAFLAGTDGDVRDLDAAPLSRAQDPLDLDVPLDNVDCTDDTLIIVGWGESYNTLSSSVADWAGARYLETGESCDTAYPQVRGKTPTYAVYVPAFDSPKAACEERMNARHKGDFVTRMREGNTDGVPCACVMDVATLPAVGEGQEPTTESGMWIYVYQQMLAEIGALDLDVVSTGQFDRATIEATLVLQTDAALNPLAYVDTDTWGVIRNKACGRFDFS